MLNHRSPGHFETPDFMIHQIYIYIYIYIYSSPDFKGLLRSLAALIAVSGKGDAGNQDVPENEAYPTVS